MKIINDTLKNPTTGHWSRKNCIAFGALLFAMFYSAYGLIYDKDVHDFVVVGFLGLVGSMMGASSWEKKNVKQPINESFTE